MGRAFKYVILGGGTAAGYAAHEFVKHGVSHGDLCIISQEAVAPYERPALSKGYLLPEGAVRLPAFHTCVATGGERQTPKWYKDHGIELLLSTKVVAAQVNRKTLKTADGETITYHMLIIATGARALKLEEFGVRGAHARKICYLRDLQDANYLVDTMARCKGGQAVVIGGGYIGMEATAALVESSISVTMVFPEPHCMARLFTPAIAKYYEDVYQSKGVNFVKGSVMVAFEHAESGEVTGVVLKDGRRLQADMVVVGVGIKPNTSLFEGQIAIEKGGISVNGKMKTSNSSVFAVGDVAAFPLKLYGDVRRLEHVDHARKSAAAAVSAILTPGNMADYDYLPYFYSRVFNHSWQFYGDNVGTSVLFGEPKRGKFGAFWVEKGILVGAFLEGGTKNEYSALSAVTRLRPKVIDVSTLSELGMAFILQIVEQRELLGDLEERQFSSSRTPKEAHSSISTLLTPSPLAVQAALGVSVAVAVAGLAFWHGKFWKGKW